MVRRRSSRQKLAPSSRRFRAPCHGAPDIRRRPRTLPARQKDEGSRGRTPWSLVGTTRENRLLQRGDSGLGLFLGGLHVTRLARSLGLLNQTGRLADVTAGLGGRAATRRLDILTTGGLSILTTSGLSILTA